MVNADEMILRGLLISLGVKLIEIIFFQVGDKTPTTTELADLMEYSFPILSIEMIDHTVENNV